MKSSHLLTIATFSVMAAGTAMALSSRLDPLPGADAPEMPELTSGMLTGEGAEAAEDSAVVLSPDSLATLAGEAFKAYRVSKFDGEEDAVLYPRLYDLYEQALAAFDAQPNATRGFMQCRDILKQIDDELLRGAFFYSSNNRREELNKFARAYLDIQQLPRMEGERWKRDEQVYPFICYIAASSAYNASEWDKAIDYFKLFLSTGASDRREQVYQFMGRACLSARNYPLAITVMQEAMKAYPQNEMLPMIGIQACIDGGHGQFLQEFLTRALELKPTDVQLMTLQGQLYEDRNDYRAAIALFNDLDRLKPNSMSITKHLGTNYYNMAVSAFNNAINEPNEKEAKRLRRQARNYFDAAALKFRAILESDPTATKYMRSLGVCYLCLEDKSSFSEINDKLTAMGEDPLADVFMPPMMTYSDSGNKNFATSSLADDGNGLDAPSYRDFATRYITERLDKWSKRGEFEPTDKYQQRVNETTLAAEGKRLQRSAAEEYLNRYGGNLRLDGLKLMPYDATNEVFKIESSYGPIILPVPLKNGEAENFKATFAGVNIRTPRYFIDEEGVKVASVTFVTPGGRSYTYDNSKALAYNDVPDIDIDYNSILRNPAKKQTQSSGAETVTIRHKSDVDKDIPQNRNKDANRLALIIANEHYHATADVASAINDGEAMAEYCKLTLGMPDNNVELLTDATLGRTLGAIISLKDKVNALGGEADVLVYYAGHGLPDERTKDAYILPVDGTPTSNATCLSLGKLYDELSNMKAKTVTVLLDACFSGAQRKGGGEMISDARSVVIKPKESAPKGNMLVLSAASGNETALPYAEKNHGLFTYYILKHLQTTKGNTTLKELSDYVISNVKKQSVFINSKLQTPTVTTSGNMGELWQTRKLKP